MTETPGELPDQGAEDSAEWSDMEEMPFEKVRELFNTLGKALRAFQLYDENNPVYKRFVSSLSEAFTALWTEIEGLNVSVEEDRFKLAGEEVYRSDSRADSLSFLPYKDGVRDVTFLPGIEGEDLPIRPLAAGRSTQGDAGQSQVRFRPADREDVHQFDGSLSRRHARDSPHVGTRGGLQDQSGRRAPAPAVGEDHLGRGGRAAYNPLSGRSLAR
jgi:hypothetical protein